MKKYKLSALVLDFDLYPRGKVDSQHVAQIAASIEAGTELPPLVIEKKTKRMVDGFHRHRSYIRVYDLDHEVLCIEKTYKDDGALFLDAMRYNAAHGRALTQHDKAHCLILAANFKLSDNLVAEALHLTTERIGTLRSTRIGRIGARPIALKQTIKHMAGRKLSEAQETVNKKLSGMNQLFYVNQVAMLIENNLVDADDDKLLNGFERLRVLLEGYLRKAA